MGDPSVTGLEIYDIPRESTTLRASTRSALRVGRWAAA